MSKQEWPKDGAPASFADIVIPLVRAFNDGATWRPKTSMRESDITWTGLPLQSPSMGPIEARLSADWRAHDRDQCRTFLDTILGIAVNLGMEQGRRIERERLEGDRRHLMWTIKGLEEILKRMEDR